MESWGGKKRKGKTGRKLQTIDNLLERFLPASKMDDGSPPSDLGFPKGNPKQSASGAKGAGEFSAMAVGPKGRA